VAPTPPNASYTTRTANADVADEASALSTDISRPRRRKAALRHFWPSASTPEGKCHCPSSQPATLARRASSLLAASPLSADTPRGNLILTMWMPRLRHYSRGTFIAMETQKLLQKLLIEDDQRRRPMPSEVNNAVHSAWNALPQSVLVENVRTLQDLAREMLRPMLKSWLDDNLPTLVERLVRVEIERLAGSKPHQPEQDDFLF